MSPPQCIFCAIYFFYSVLKFSLNTVLDKRKEKCTFMSLIFADIHIWELPKRTTVFLCLSINSFTGALMDVNTLLKGTLTVASEEEKSQLHSFLYQVVWGFKFVTFSSLQLPAVTVLDLFQNIWDVWRKWHARKLFILRLFQGCSENNVQYQL